MTGWPGNKQPGVIDAWFFGGPLDGAHEMVPLSVTDEREPPMEFYATRKARSDAWNDKWIFVYSFEGWLDGAHTCARYTWAGRRAIT